MTNSNKKISKQDVIDYYLSIQKDLSAEKRFHFLSRLHLWLKEPQYRDYVESLKPSFIVEKETSITYPFFEKIERNKTHIPYTNAGIVRRPYDQAYPRLRKINKYLFHALFLYTVYGYDSRQELSNFKDLENLDELAASLIEDEPAIAILSTHAINFFYIYRGFLQQRENQIDLDKIIKIGGSFYDLDNRTHLKLLIYLFTHCIIGESYFYYRTIPKQKVKKYREMLDYLDHVIASRYFQVNLDCKLEFLVCCRILNYKSKIEPIIRNEAISSGNEKKQFIIDTYNQDAGNKITPQTSEHRNILFILSESPYQPRIM